MHAAMGLVPLPKSLQNALQNRKQALLDADDAKWVQDSLHGHMVECPVKARNPRLTPFQPRLTPF